MKFCDKLANLRKKNNMSQEQLADKLGVSRQAVSKWESETSLKIAINCFRGQLLL